MLAGKPPEDPPPAPPPPLTVLDYARPAPRRRHDARTIVAFALAVPVGVTIATALLHLGLTACCFLPFVAGLAPIAIGTIVTRGRVWAALLLNPAILATLVLRLTPGLPTTGMDWLVLLAALIYFEGLAIAIGSGLTRIANP
jgi:hypothetical protein